MTTPNSTIALNEWQHVTVTVEATSTNTTAKFYVDGELVHTELDIGQPTNGEHMTIGAHYYDVEQFNGIIDEVRVFDRCLSADEIETLYKTKFSFSLSILAYDTYNTPITTPLPGTLGDFDIDTGYAYIVSYEDFDIEMESPYEIDVPGYYYVEFTFHHYYFDSTTHYSNSTTISANADKIIKVFYEVEIEYY